MTANELKPDERASLVLASPALGFLPQRGALVGDWRCKESVGILQWTAEAGHN